MFPGKSECGKHVIWYKRASEDSWYLKLLN